MSWNVVDLVKMLNFLIWFLEDGVEERVRERVRVGVVILMVIGYGDMFLFVCWLKGRIWDGRRIIGEIILK